MAPPRAGPRADNHTHPPLPYPLRDCQRPNPSYAPRMRVLKARADQSQSMRVLGIMSGTSMDQIDFAVCDISAKRLRLCRTWNAPFPTALRRQLQAIASNSASAWELAQTHHDLGRFVATQAKLGLGKTRISLVGWHGQTVFHQPSLPAPATLQIGEPAWLAETLRVPIVAQFRVADLAAGGQGAPLATLFHHRVFARRGRHVCVHNLGGISNVTSLWDRDPDQPPVLAFDTGPANMLLDLAVQRSSRGRCLFDQDGRSAATGQVREDLLLRWLTHPYFSKPPPKSTGRELFGEHFLEQAWAELRRKRCGRNDALATLSEFTARSILLNYLWHLPHPIDRVVLTGGGASNPDLVQRISRALRSLNLSMEILTSADLGWPHQTIEPAAFALLAWERWHGRPGNLRETTGARRSVLCGSVTAP